MDNGGIEKLQMNSTDLGDEVSLLLASKLLTSAFMILQSSYVRLKGYPMVMFLKCQSLSVQGAKAIADLLKKNSNLRVIELNNNMIEYSVCNYLNIF